MEFRQDKAVVWGLDPLPCPPQEQQSLWRTLGPPPNAAAHSVDSAFFTEKISMLPRDVVDPVPWCVQQGRIV